MATYLMCSSKKGVSSKQLERNGRVLSQHVPAVNAATLRPILYEQIAKGTQVYTDEAAQYTMPPKPMFEKHDYVSRVVSEYVRGDVHTSTIEGYFSIFKRGMNGVYQHCSKVHMKRYLSEFYFRYNYREKQSFDDIDRTHVVVKGIGGKRLTYQSLDSQ